MTRRRTVSLLLATLACHGPWLDAAHAQEPAPAEPSTPSAPPLRTLGLAQAIAYARVHQPEVKVALARLRAQRSQVEIPRSQWLPSVGATAQIFAATANNTTGTYATSSLLDLPRIGGTRSTASGTFRPYASTIAAIGAGQELFDFGRIAAQTAAQDALVSVEQERVHATALDVTFDVEEAYFAVLAAKSILKASQEALERATVHRDLAKAGVDSGLRSPIELTRAQAELGRLETARLRAQGGLSMSQTTLAATIGAPDAAIDAGAAPESPPDLPQLTAALSEAAERDPHLRATIAQLQAAEARARAIDAELRPDVSLTATFSGRAGGAPPSSGPTAHADGFVPNVPNWDLGVVFTWPLFDGTIRARAEAARSEAGVRSEQVAQVRHEQAARVRLAYETVSVAKSALPGLQRSLDAALANYDQADARFKSGLGTSVELADAEALRTDAEIQLALGRFTLAQARAAFGRAIAEGL